MQACVSEQDTVAHVSGDEFSVILDDIYDEEEISAVADNMLTALSAAFQTDGKEIFTSGSIGVTPYTGSATNINELFKNVYTAIHHAKRQG